jgi:hypothetical protein
MTDLWLLAPIVTLSQNPMRESKSTQKRVTGPLKLRPEVAYTPWEDRAKEVLVEEMRKRKLGYKELARLLEPYGIDETPDQINRKANRKRFSAAFLLACLAAMEVTAVEVPTQLGVPKSYK